MTKSKHNMSSADKRYLFAYDINSGKVNVVEKPTEQKKLSAVIYARVSSRAQVSDGSGLEHQE